MADSKRESIMKHLADVLAATAGVQGRVYRSEPDGVDRESQPCVLLRWTGESRTPMTVLELERTLQVEVDVLTRGDSPDALADPIAQSLHALLTADSTLGGRAIDITLGDARFEYTSADETAGKLTHEYLVLFRHSHADMAA
jgi:hypothetical protein